MERNSLIEFIGCPGSGKTTISKYFLADKSKKYYIANRSLKHGHVNSLFFVWVGLSNIIDFCRLLLIVKKTKINFTDISKILLSYKVLTRVDKVSLVDQGIINFLITAVLNKKVSYDLSLKILSQFLNEQSVFIMVDLPQRDSFLRLKNRDKSHHLDIKEEIDIKNYYSKYEETYNSYLVDLKLNVTNIDGSHELMINKIILDNLFYK
jgi:hypothetical protein